MVNNQNMPKEKGLDHTISLLKEGYNYIYNRKDKYHSRVFQTRIMGEKANCLIGTKEAELFYDNNKFIRKGAAPSRIQKTLFGEGGVQGLDGEKHHHRKAVFMSFMTKEMLSEVKELTEMEWERAITRNQTEEFNVYEEAKRVLTNVAMRWVGIPMQEDERELTDELDDLFEDASAIGLKHWKARMSRSKTEDWIKQLVLDIRNGKLTVDQRRPLYQFSMHRDLDGQLLEPEIVSVEVLNLIRPIVAVSVYVDFTILASIQFPKEVEKLQQGNDKQLQFFIQEVRRFYPFFPFTVARVKKGFEWNGYTFEEGTLTLLDLYGTNHDPEIWKEPDHFLPDRFKEWNGNPFDFIPQGGGEFDIGHRCAGEWMTIDILKVTLNYFVNKISYEVPQQDFTYSMNDIPSLPASRVILENIRRK
ncbi:fatty-acid peroxygenase [Gracilibacillus ureilyticus]|uniref:Fatty-acid peroxygenase n=1 Tax=Gracilibacillus ureilyticus TaxID=531814 RepID=A0A1H9UU52_9BACI|nr:cytochrome P450 [Gracilibacillus ureilyticus]SES13005.1 fatty-acid peroxygenase [Gracilibacillus ureilyticus]